METYVKKKIVVWIVEDNTLLRQTFVGFIQNNPDMVCGGEFSTCEAAVAALKSRPRPDVVLQDIGFKGMDGIQCVEIIKKQYPDTQIIMITVYDDSDNIFRAICAGATGYLVKTAKEDIIIKSIIDVLSGGSPMNSYVARKAIEIFAMSKKIPNDYHLSVREKEILDQIVQGNGNKSIAKNLNISTHTIDAHLRKIYEKLHVHSRTSAVAKALKEKIV